MPSQTTNYQCPACTGPLHFDGASGKLRCDYCGSSYSVEEIEKLYGVQNQAAAAATAAMEQVQTEPDEVSEEEYLEDWDSSGAGEWGAESAKLAAYNCTSCGAELICDKTTAATECPYCGNPTIIPGKLTGNMKPEYVLPFRLDKKAATDALRNHYKGKKLLPKAFTSENHIQKIQGVYVPFWLYSGTVDVDMNFAAEQIMTHREGDFEVTQTYVYDIHRSGSVDFRDIPVDASTKMDDALMDSLEPYDYSDLKPFSLSYLPGFLADRYDVSMEECSRRADERAVNTAESTVRNTVNGYVNIHLNGKNLRLRRGKATYVLMPVWMLNTKYGDKNYTFAMNGQTGKFVGDLPMDKGLWRKYLLIYGGSISAVLFAIASLIMH